MIEIKKSLLIIICFFTFASYVNAGVCSNKTISSGSYCKSDHSYIYTKGNRYFNRSGSNGYIGYPYVSNSSTYSNNIEYAFCLDPGLTEPTTVNFNYVRELNLGSSYGEFDKNVYKTYQYYVNALKYDINNGLGLINQNKYLSFTDVALRVFTFKNNVDVDNAYIRSKTNYIDYRDVVAPYILGTSEKWSNDNIKYFATLNDLNEVKDYFENVNNYNLWENPLTITPTTKFQHNKYIYNFEVKFDNGVSKYFGDAGEDYDIGYGNAFFEYELKINDGTYSLITYASDYSGGGRIDRNTPNANQTINFKVEIPKEKYEEIISNSGYVNVSLDYTTYHPMSSDNVFLNYYDNRESDSTALYQRMVVFSAVRKHEVINSNGTISSTENKCYQNGDTFYYNDEQVTINEYKNNCTCSNINKNNITNVNLLNEYKILCPSPTKNEYSSTLGECRVGEENIITHDVVKSINEYCTLSCTETIEIENLTDKYETTAGRYFKFDEYPKLSANKSCNVKIKYDGDDGWYKKYESIAEDLAEKLTEWNLYEAVSDAEPTEEICGDSYHEYPKNIYYISYITYSYSEGGFSKSTENAWWGGCEGKKKPKTDSSAEEDFKSYLSDMKQHLNDLKNCSTYLSNMGNTSQFYNFKIGMSFYYEQDYSKFGTIRNDNKPNNDVDDSKLEYTEIDRDDTGRYNISSNTSFETFNESGSIITKDITGNNFDDVFTRNVELKYKFEPSVNKAIDVYTQKIREYNAYLTNPIELGEVYDIDITAIEKDDNRNYYVFNALGDNNEIYKYFKNGGNNDYSPGKDGIEALKRYCTYKINNDIFQTCSDASCNSKLNLIYRSVDPSNIDPNKRLERGIGFSNWTTDNAKVVKKKIEDDAKTKDTYSPKYLEYSFTLDSGTLQAIREYNDSKKYDDFNLDCSEGKECKSTFISNAYAKDGITGDVGIKFGNGVEINGRNKWKEITHIGGNKYTIDGEEVILNS